MNCKAAFSLFMVIYACLLAGCDDVSDGLYEMAFGEDMQITTTSAPAGKVGGLYQWPIYAEVKNDPNDDAYDYDWAFIEGTLPEGLTFSDEGDNALVSGTPKQSGDFKITISVSSDKLQIEEEWDDDSDVWSSSSSREFIITIKSE